ncbi:hypothetical protein HY502_00145 [Candidatus Woesebacteria bacterium]|nr:hypothetical protein [Candidatus Woesebacteria bacterium]
MPYQLLLRLVLALAFGALGNLLARTNIPPNLPFPLPIWANLFFTVLFAALGAVFIDIVSFAARSGLTRLAEAIAKGLAAQVRMRRPRSQKREGKDTNPLVLDTSAIIDSRIADVAKTGFLNGTIYIIPSVLGELQHIADSQDDLRRQRGRRGLEALESLKKVKNLKVIVLDADPEDKEVDEKLINLGKKLKARIITCDYNLSKVARVKGIESLNVNELAQAVRVQVIPSEELKVSLVHPGKTKDQAVGYLPDGTMIVVEGGASYIGKEIVVVVSRSLQTVAGRMIFARPKS